MSQITEWSCIDDQSFIQWAVQNAKTPITVKTAEGPTSMLAGYFLFNAPLLSSLWRFNIDVPRDFLFKDGELFTDKVRQTMHTKIVDLLVSQGITSDALSPYLRQMVSDSAMVTNILSTELAPWFRTMDLFRICEAMQQPDIKKVLDSYKPEEIYPYGIKKVEEAFKQHTADVLDILSTVKENNALCPFLKMGAFNNGQLVQLISSAGTRSDVNESMFNTVFKNSYMEGFPTQAERALDSRSSVKAKFYSKQHMQKAQYNNRQMQLLCCSVKRIYPGDCGSQVHLPFHIPKGKGKSMSGCNVLNKDGSYSRITIFNAVDFEGKDVLIRNPIGCRHNDGFCQTCGGGMSDWLHYVINPGINAVLVVISTVVQSILSAKHHVVTKASSYMVPPSLSALLWSFNNETYIKKGVKYKHLSIGIPTIDVEHISDLDYVSTPDLNERFFSSITSMSLAESKTGKPVTPDICMVSKDRCVPYFSEDFLEYLRNTPDAVIQNGSTTWFKLEGFDSQYPLLKSVSVNESALAYMTRLMQLFSKDASKMKNASVALSTLANMIWERVPANILHISILLKALMITSDTDMTIPVVYDKHGRNVKFGSFKTIIKNRHIGTEAAYQEWSSQITNPSFYTQDKTDSPFDLFMGTRDHHFPEEYGFKPRAERDILDQYNTSSTIH